MMASSKAGARHLERGGLRNAVHGQHADIRRAAADVDDHPALGGGDIELRAEGSSQRRFDEVDAAGACLHGSLNDGTLLDLRDAAGDCDDHARLDDGVAEHAAEHLRQHAGRELIVGDDAVLQRVHGDDIARACARACSARPLPTCSTLPLFLSRAMTDGSRSTMPRPAA